MGRFWGLGRTMMMRSSMASSAVKAASVSHVGGGLGLSSCFGFEGRSNISNRKTNTDSSRQFSSSVHKHSLQRIAVKRLDEIVKVPLLKANPPNEIQRIWEEHHQETVSSVGHVLPAGEWLMLQDRARRSPMFIYPVSRPSSDSSPRKGFFTLVGQWQDKSLIFTFLEDFRSSPMTAQPWLAFSAYDELAEEKGLALMRGEFTTRLDKDDVENIMNSVRHFYLGDGYRHVETFNHQPDQFNFSEVFPGIGF